MALPSFDVLLLSAALVAQVAGCTFRETGVATDRRSDGARPADAPRPFDGPIEGDGGSGGVARDGGEGGAGGSAGGAAGSGGAPAEIDAREVGPACPSPMKECDGACIAADGCCRDGDCPPMTATGQLGKCDRQLHMCQYMCPPDTKPCAGKCIAMTACCADGDCPGNTACVDNACAPEQCRSGFKRCGSECIALTTCCRADGCCSHADCGLCQKCASGRCVSQGGSEDLKNECAAGACRTGNCNGNGGCGTTTDGQNGPSCGGECQLCRAGRCEPRTGVCSTGQMCEAGRCPPRPPVAVRININGPPHGGFAGDPGAGGACGPNPFRNDTPIGGTNDDPLYHGEMFGRPLVCKVGSGLPPGQYHVVLHFAEIFWGPGCPGGGLGVGARVFDIAMEGRTVARGVDIYSEGRCAASLDGLGRPVVKRFMTTITDGSLDLTFEASVDNGKISAIEVLSAW